MIRAAGCFLLFVLLLTGCATVEPIAPVDLSAAAWTVRQGQALWRPDDEKPEIAGDVVVSSHPTGGSYVQFSKTLPILSGRISPAGWEFASVAENKRYSGRGEAPKRIVWLQMLRALEGKKISDRWTVANPSEQFILLENQHSGERLEVQFEK